MRTSPILKLSAKNAPTKKLRNAKAAEEENIEEAAK